MSLRPARGAAWPRYSRAPGVTRSLEPLALAGRLPVPRLRGTVQHGPWFALVVQDVEGRHPAVPWRDRELVLVLAALDRLATWEVHAADGTLLHADIRVGNLLLTGQAGAGGRVMVVDWPHACRGAAFVDLVCFAPSVAMQGGPGSAELLAMLL